MSATVPDFTQAATNSPALPQSPDCATSDITPADLAAARKRFFDGVREDIIADSGVFVGGRS